MADRWQTLDFTRPNAVVLLQPDCNLNWLFVTSEEVFVIHDRIAHEEPDRAAMTDRQVRLIESLLMGVIANDIRHNDAIMVCLELLA